MRQIAVHTADIVVATLARPRAATRRMFADRG